MSVQFDVLYNEDALDMDTIYDELASQVEDDKKDFPTSGIVEQVLRDYDEAGKFTFRTRLTLFSTALGDREEYAFACASKNPSREGRINIYFVSDAYNITIASDVPTDAHIQARFVCLVVVSRCHLVALAERSALAFPSSNPSRLYALQNIYRRVRHRYDIG